jgi:hypothetical protein
MLGDRRSLLIIRDMMLFGYRSLKEFLNSHEGIATDSFADRLQRLENCGIMLYGPRSIRRTKTYLLSYGKGSGPCACSDRNGFMGSRTRRDRQSGSGPVDPQSQRTLS